ERCAEEGRPHEDHEDASAVTPALRKEPAYRRASRPTPNPIASRSQVSGVTPRSRNRCFITRKVAFFGNSGTTSTYRGIAKYGSTSLKKANSSEGEGTPESETTTMHALMSSSVIGLGTPMTAASAIAGCET